MTLSGSTGPSRKRAAEMFNRISKTYDILNMLLSGGIDRYWRWQTARHFNPKHHHHILDCATGTGDQLFAIMRRAGSTSVQGVGIDPSPGMLALAHAKNASRPYRANCQFVETRADSLPFDAMSFDLITMSFGIRNVENVPHTLTEIRRVLKPGGKMLILEFALPTFSPLRKLHLFYLHRILPRIGKWVSGDDAAYTYLAHTITTFPYGNDFCQLVKQAGFASCHYQALTLGIVNLYVAENC